MKLIIEGTEEEILAVLEKIEKQRESPQEFGQKAEDLPSIWGEEVIHLTVC